MGPDHHAVSQHGSPPGVAPAKGGPSVAHPVIDEHRPMRNKTITADRHEFANEGVGLHPCSRPDNHVILDFDKGPDEAIVPQRAAVEIHRLHDFDPFAKRHVDDSGLQYLGFGHVAKLGNTEPHDKRSYIVDA